MHTLRTLQRADDQVVHFVVYLSVARHHNNAPAHAYSSPPVRCQVLSQQVDLLLKYARNRLMDQFHGMYFANREIFCRQQNPRLLAASDRG